ncbi:hypothetical protein ACQP06_18885 [Nocardia sp. CA-136227]|uniref:hypothetical protein n=1 Tax=Nocardia sp. CA-136227 TaxID=3239979 RepID=UPI003D95C1CA
MTSLQHDIGRLLIESRRILDAAAIAWTVNGAAACNPPDTLDDDWSASLQRILYDANDEVVVAVSKASTVVRHHDHEQALLEALLAGGRRIKLLRSSTYARSRDSKWDSPRIRPHVRVVDGEFDNAIIVDRRLAVVWNMLDDSSRSASVITEPAVLRALYRYMVMVWSNSTSLPPVAEADLPLLDGPTVAVINALSVGETDEVAARRLFVSLRTYRRYVAEAMTQLGVTTRFQLGMRAAELGILAHELSA